MSLAGRLAFASPILLTLIWGGGLLAAVFREEWPLLVGVGELAIFVLPVTWAWAVYAISRQILRGRGDPVRRADWIFVLTISGNLATIVMQAMTGSVEKSEAQTLAEMPVVLGLFVCAGVTGRALDRAERASTADAFSRTLLNAIILLFEPIGFWILKPRLAVLRAQLNT